MSSTSEESLNTSLIESLPTEVLQKILASLPFHDRLRVERVCKRWKNVSTERLWKDVQVLHIVSSERKEKYHRFRYYLEKFGKFIAIENNEISIDADELGIIKSLVSRAGKHVKKLILAIKDSSESTTFVLSIIAAHCHNIEMLHLNFLEDSALRVFSNLLEVNEQLRSIRCFEVDNIIEILPLRDWKSLDFALMCLEENLVNKFIELIKNSPSLEELYAAELSSNILAAIANCEQLKTLYLPSWFGEEMYDKVMNLSWLDRLTCLEIISSVEDGNSIIDLLHRCVNLKSLSLYCRRKLPLNLAQAVLALPKLESLDLSSTRIPDVLLTCLVKFKRLRITQTACDFPLEDEIFKMIVKSEFLEKLEIPKLEVTAELFKKLAQNAGERHKILEIEVSTKIYEKASEICRGTKIHITEEKDTDDEASFRIR